MATSKSAPGFPLLLLLAIISVIPLNMFVPALPTIADDFGVEYGVVNIAIGGYAIVMAITQVVGGALSDRYGRRPVALGALGIFTLASLGCIVAPNVELFLGFRMLQGVAAACQSVALASIRDLFQGAEMRSKIGSLSSAWALGPMVGPTVGGFLASGFGWRSIFVLFAVLGTIGFFFVYTGFAETNRDRSDRLMDLASYAEIIKSRLFWAYSFVMVCSMGTLYVYLGAAPAVGAQMGNLSEGVIGLMIGLIPTGFMIGSATTSRVSRRVPAHQLILFGRTLTVAGMIIAIGLMWAGIDHPAAFFLPCISIGMGNGFTHPPANAGVLIIAGRNAGVALGLASAIAVSGAALVSFVAGFVIQGGDIRASTLYVLQTIAIAALLIAIFIYSEARAPRQQEDRPVVSGT